MRRSTIDPTANLEEQLQLSKQILSDAETENATVEALQEDLIELAQLVVALDDWLRKEGALPKQWQNGWVKFPIPKKENQ